MFKNIVLLSESFESLCGKIEFALINIGYSSKAIITGEELLIKLENKQDYLGISDEVLVIIDPDYGKEYQTIYSKIINGLMNLKTKFYEIKAYDKVFHKDYLSFASNKISDFYSKATIFEINRIGQALPEFLFTST